MKLNRRQSFALALLPLASRVHAMSSENVGEPRALGRRPDGTEVNAITLGSESGLMAEILTLGGTLSKLSFPVHGKRRSMILELPDLAAYERDTSYLGQLVGRYGNRIGGAAFELEGKKYSLTANNGPNTLHGGAIGFGERVWKLLGSGKGRTSYVKLGHRSPAGEDGFPGNLDVTALISIYDNTLTLAFEAVTDAPTPISFTWHPYFNISGDPGRSIDEQTLRIAASKYLPVNASRVPTGELVSVAGTPFDFRRAKSPRVPKTTDAQLNLTGGFDHCWVLDPKAAIAAELHSPASGVTMKVRTDLPGLQVYGAYHLRTAYPGMNAICVEPEGFPDAPNHPAFPNSILRPGEVHRSKMSFEFDA
jgi:aldose 1-epimerase